MLIAQCAWDMGEERECKQKERRAGRVMRKEQGIWEENEKGCEAGRGRSKKKGKEQGPEG
jgi:hypothetical protein